MAKAIPDGFHTITAHLVVSDAAKAIEFYKKALGAQEIDKFMAPDGKAVMHAQLKIGDSMLMLGSEHPPHCLSPKSRGGTSATLNLYVENADAAFDRAVKAGCTVKMPMSDQFWGDRYGQVEDPFGHQWSFATHKQEPDERPDQRQRQGLLREDGSAASARNGDRIIEPSKVLNCARVVFTLCAEGPRVCFFEGRKN